MSSLLNKTQTVSGSADRPDFWSRGRKILLVVCGFGAGIVFRSMLAQKPNPSRLASRSTNSLFQPPVLAAQAPTRQEPILQQVISPGIQEPVKSVPPQEAGEVAKVTTPKEPVLAAIVPVPAHQKQIAQQAFSPSIQAPTTSVPSPVTRSAQQFSVTKQPVLAASVPTPAQQEPIAQQATTLSIEEPPKSTPPQVTYEAGQLTIIAENAKLSDVLSSVHKSTGADIDLPASASSERIWAQLGPGPARKILATLLSETKLDYIIQASDVDPDGIRNVWLTARTEAPNAAVTARASNAASRQPPPISRGSDTDRRAMPNSMRAAERAAEPRVVEETVIPEPPAPAEAAPAPAVQPPAAADAATGTQPTTADSTTPAAPQPPPATTDAAAPSATPAASPAAPAAQAAEPNNPSASPTNQMIQTLQNMYEQRKQMQLARTPQSTN